jgi:hypothetical protein
MKSIEKRKQKNQNRKKNDKRQKKALTQELSQAFCSMIIRYQKDLRTSEYIHDVCHVNHRRRHRTSLKEG